MKNKSIKKIVIVLCLSLFLAFSLTACGDGLLEGFFAIGVIFLSLVSVFYVFSSIKNKAEEKQEEQEEAEPINYYNKKLLLHREEMIGEWMREQYKKNPAMGGFFWHWINKHENTISFIAGENGGFRYEGKVLFAEEGHPECHDQERVLRIESVIQGTDVRKVWEGTETEQHKQYKRRAAELAFKHYSNAYELDESVADKMADLYFNGIGTDQDEKKAMKY